MPNPTTARAIEIAEAIALEAKDPKTRADARRVLATAAGTSRAARAALERVEASAATRLDRQMGLAGDDKPLIEHRGTTTIFNVRR